MPPSTESPVNSDDPHAECLRFSLHSSVEETEVIPPNPVTAKDYVRARTDGQLGDLDRHLEFLYYEDVHAYDSMVTGWILSPPINFSVETTDDGSYTVTTTHSNNETSIVEVVEIEGETMLSVNSMWNINLPEGYTGLLLHPFSNTKSPNQNRVVPQVIQQETSSNVVTVLLEIENAFEMTTQDALVQFIPIEEETVPASYRTTESEEFTTITKEQRKQELYPNEYGNSREEKRWGDIVDVRG